ncbi:ATP-binding protein [Halanaerobacter jeridensis]|uniref:histidine kinase n=1 Tax=Halanaerobacter jeridensis TaxID=706427 RepID=A0A938XQ44_9FIRM|nr:ATP-binding protein [Halanaerobacter jeridensis]MBM7557743.1 hypothetical protein [Halanaerobacter jeridensis]
MRELSLHILDIVQNSIAAEADLIRLNIVEDYEADKLVVEIIDDGTGMKEEDKEQVLDPFVTSRTTREVGLGLPLFKEAAEQCAGNFSLDSTLGEGTELKAVFQHSHIDRAPLGDIVGTIISFLVSNPDIDLVYHHQVDDEEFNFDTREVKDRLGDVKINSPDIIAWLKDYLTEGLRQIRR